MIHMFQLMNNVVLEVTLHLIKGKDHLRGISRELKSSPATISRNLNKLTKEGVIDYRTEGKNKVFFLKKNSVTRALIISAEQYKLIKLIKQYPKLGVITDELVNRPEDYHWSSFSDYQGRPGPVPVRVIPG